MAIYQCRVRREKTEGCNFPWEEDLVGEVEANFPDEAARMFAELQGTHQDCVPLVSDESVEVRLGEDLWCFFVTAEVKVEWQVQHEVPT